MIVRTQSVQTDVYTQLLSCVYIVYLSITGESDAICIVNIHLQLSNQPFSPSALPVRPEPADDRGRGPGVGGGQCNQITAN